jgi:ABC-2 type transport system permease protein
MKHIYSKKNRVLLSELVRTDFKLRYQGSALGYAWSLLRPLMLFLILYLVFVKFLRFGGDIPNFPVYLLLGIVLWNFFNEMTAQSLGSIVGRGDLIRKIKIPRWIIVLSSSISASINLLLNLLVVLIFVIISDVEITTSILWLPLILVQVYVFALGLSLFLSAAFVKYRDVVYIWEVILQALFYLTPILYPLSMVPNLTFQKILLLNPMAQAIQDARYAVITQETVTLNKLFEGGWYMLLPYFFIVTVLIIGTAYFRKESKHFAENL